MEAHTNRPKVFQHMTPFFMKILIVGLAIIVNLSAAAFILLPKWAEVRDSQSEYAALEGKLMQLQSERTNENVSVQAIEDLRAQVPVVRHDSDSLIHVNRLADRTSTRVTEVSQVYAPDEGKEAKKEKDASGVLTSTFDVGVIGHLNHLLAYIEEAHNDKRLLTIRKWSLQKSDVNSLEKDYPDLYRSFSFTKGKAIYSLKLTIDFYAMPQFEKALGAH